ncbi:MAG: hypothetical protein CMI53_01900 [Parcubacteria group bacterium]|jgi:hypothetical protein|nr:hypothetical protein [Parcubacteria group bacterium]|tara:strand:- start:4138 stop:4479 length:342 start_codon:yes stop_codon:yes gene_type:complete
MLFFGAMPMGVMIVVMFGRGMLVFMFLGFVLLAFIKYLLYFFPQSNDTDLYIQYRYPHQMQKVSLNGWRVLIYLPVKKGRRYEKGRLDYSGTGNCHTGYHSSYCHTSNTEIAN